MPHNHLKMDKSSQRVTLMVEFCCLFSDVEDTVAMAKIKMSDAAVTGVSITGSRVAVTEAVVDITAADGDATLLRLPASAIQRIFPPWVWVPNRLPRLRLPPRARPKTSNARAGNFTREDLVPCLCSVSIDAVIFFFTESSPVLLHCAIVWK